MALDEGGQDSEPPQRLWLEAVVETGDWSAIPDPEAVVARIARALEQDPAVAARVNRPSTACIAFSSDADVRGLNARYRVKDKPTNVLSFPAAPLPADVRFENAPVALGDVILAAETVASEARELGISPGDHILHLVTHGVLHLLGYDHESDEDAAEMEALETRILAGLGVADPYRSNE